LVHNNLFEADGGCPIDDMASGSSYYRWYNNTITVPTNTRGAVITGRVRLYGIANSTNVEFKNNICHGLDIRDAGSSSTIDWTKIVHTNNIYTALTSAQSDANGFSMGTNEASSTTGSVFESPANGNYNLKVGSPAIGVGANLSSYFTEDIAGNPRTNWDIGTYTYVPLTNSSVCKISNRSQFCAFGC
jgi:hypothetical protein